MRKLLLTLVPALLLSGCASLWKTMGVATVAEEKTRAEAASREIADVRRLLDELSSKALKEERVEELERSVAELSAAAEDAKQTRAAVEELKALVAEFEGRTEAIPAETLRRLVEILNAALAEP